MQLLMKMEKFFSTLDTQKQFKIYDIADGKVVSAEVVDTNGSGHGALAGFLVAAWRRYPDLRRYWRRCPECTCPGWNPSFRRSLSGNADEAVNALLAGNLGYDPDVHCDHHDHHGEGHSCGDHGCGSHSCH